VNKGKSRATELASSDSARETEPDRTDGSSLRRVVIVCVSLERIPPLQHLCAKPNEVSRELVTVSGSTDAPNSGGDEATQPRSPERPESVGLRLYRLVEVSDKSAIEWTEATWNPVPGSDRVS
jgi:hypothetical protein